MGYRLGSVAVPRPANAVTVTWWTSQVWCTRGRVEGRAAEEGEQLLGGAGVGAGVAGEREPVAAVGVVDQRGRDGEQEPGEVGRHRGRESPGRS